jgi:FkbM family methyltransferase
MSCFTRIALLRDKYHFEPKVIYDIGAHQGVWTMECQKIFPMAKFYQFEANLNKRKFIPNAFFDVLADKDGKEVQFYRTTTECDTGNSIYRENTQYFNDENVLIEERTTKKLDTIVEENKLPPPDFMKLDTQGSELNIISGAKNIMKSVQVILMEISLHEYNVGVPLLNHVICTMSGLGFVLFDIIELHYIQDVLIQIDGLFCRVDSDFLVKKF